MRADLHADGAFADWPMEVRDGRVRVRAGKEGLSGPGPRSGEKLVRRPKSV